MNILVDMAEIGDEILPCLHSNIEGNPWNHTMYKEYLLELADVKDRLKGRNEEYVYVLIDFKDKKLMKWEIMFGFEPYMMYGEYLLMRQET